MPKITTPTLIPPVIIARLLERTGSPLAPLAEEIYHLAVCERIDAAFALAQCMVESRLGCKLAAQINRNAALVPLSMARLAEPARPLHLGGTAAPVLTARYGDEHHTGYVTYPSWLTGLEEYFRLLRRVFVDARHEERVEDIARAFLAARPSERAFEQKDIETIRAGELRAPQVNELRSSGARLPVHQASSPIRLQAINAYTRQIEHQRALFQREVFSDSSRRS